MIECWKSIYPLLNLLHLHEERRSWLRNNGRRNGSASYRALWKGESYTLSGLNAFLGATCERPHETHKGIKTDKSTKERKQGEKYVNI